MASIYPSLTGNCHDTYTQFFLFRFLFFVCEALLTRFLLYQRQFDSGLHKRKTDDYIYIKIIFSCWKISMDEILYEISISYFIKPAPIINIHLNRFVEIYQQNYVTDEVLCGRLLSTRSHVSWSEICNILKLYVKKEKCDRE